MASKKKTEYILITDNDGHWFVIPADKQDEWWSYLIAVDAAGNPSDDNPPDYPQEPEWVEQVGGAPLLVRFTEYKIG